MARQGHSGASENVIGLLQFYKDLKLLSLSSQQQGKAAVQKVATASIARWDERKYVTLMKHKRHHVRPSRIQVKTAS